MQKILPPPNQKIINLVFVFHLRTSCKHLAHDYANSAYFEDCKDHDQPAHNVQSNLDRYCLISVQICIIPLTLSQTSSGFYVSAVKVF